MDAINADALNVSVPLGEDYPEIREGVRAICKKYPGEYWRKLEDNDYYAEEFIQELTDAGYLAAQIPEEYGGSGLPLRAGCAILEAIRRRWPCQRLRVADRGLREGILVEMMAEDGVWRRAPHRQGGRGQ